jgi:aspartate oxidase
MCLFIAARVTFYVIKIEYVRFHILTALRNASIIRTLIMEAVRTSETSIYFKETTWHYIP